MGVRLVEMRPCPRNVHNRKYHKLVGSQEIHHGTPKDMIANDSELAALWIHDELDRDSAHCHGRAFAAVLESLLNKG